MRKFLLMFSLLCVFLMFRLTTSQRASGFDFQQWLAGEEKAKAAFLRLSSSEQSAYIVPAFRAVYQRQVSLETLLPFFQSFREFTLREMIQVLSSFSPQSPFSIQKGENALQILGSLEPEALEALPFLLEVYPLLPLNLQHLVLELLEGWGSQAHRASLFVEERLSDPSLQIQEQGVLTLAEVDPENPKLFSSLLLVLKSGSEEKRKKAVYSLGKLKIATKREGERVSALLHALEDESPYVSLEALNALKVIPWDTENYFSSLVAFLQKEKWYVRKNTASLAAALKIKNLLPSLYQAIQEEQEQVFKKTKPEERFQHIRVFGALAQGILAINPEDPYARRALIHALGHRNRVVRLEAAEALLFDLKEREGVFRVLQEGLQVNNEKTCLKVLQLLRLLQEDSAPFLPLLRLLLENNSPFVVQSALEVLYFLPQKEALFLVFTKTQYPHPRRVRQSAYRVLERWAEQQERE